MPIARRVARVDTTGETTYPQHDCWAVYNYPNTATAASVTKAAVSGKKHYVTGVFFQVDEDPTSTKVTLTDTDTGVVWSATVEQAGTYIVHFPKPIVAAAANKTMVFEFDTQPSTAKQQVVGMFGYTE